MLRRAQRVTKDAMDAIGDKVIGAQWLAIASFTAELTKQDYLAVGAESAFAKAWDAMADVMHTVLEELDIGDEAALAASALAGRLRADGFYLLA